MTDFIHRPAGTGEANNAFHLDRRFLISDAESGGGFALFEEHVPEGSGPPMHIHRTEAEVFYVLSGQLRFHCDGAEVAAGQGDTILIPPGKPHTFKALEDSRALILLSPGAGMNMFRDIAAEGLSPPGDMQRIAAIAGSYGVEFVGPPLA